MIGKGKEWNRYEAIINDSCEIAYSLAAIVTERWIGLTARIMNK